jgi:hypothetical protein
MLVIQFIVYIISVASDVFRVFSAAIRDNKLIATYNTLDALNTKVIIYELKEGTTQDIFDSRKVFDYGSVDIAFALAFLDFPDDLQSNNKLWLTFDLRVGEGFIYSNVSSFINWAGYIDLNNMTLEDGSSLFQFPTHDNFPVGKYTINMITNKSGSVLYVTGGYIRNKNDDKWSASNSFFKYNFTTKEWADITYLASGKIEPVVDHKSVVIDNRFLVILGGNKASSIDSSGYYSLYNLSVFDTFTNNWEVINIKPDVFDTSKTGLVFLNFLPIIYNNIIIVFGGTASENFTRSANNTHLGILDFKSKDWNWSPILNEDGSEYNSKRNNHNLVILNDQLIILSGKFIIIILYFS